MTINEEVRINGVSVFCSECAKSTCGYCHKHVPGQLIFRNGPDNANPVRGGLWPEWPIPVSETVTEICPSPFGLVAPMSIGWSCPRCSRVYAPHINECEPCNATRSSDIL